MEGHGGFGVLLFVCTAMFASSVVAGLLAGALPLRDQSFRDVNALGGGLLLGAALGIVLPEGFALVAKATQDASMNPMNDEDSFPSSFAGCIVLVGFVGMLVLERLGNAQGAACASGLERVADPEGTAQAEDRRLRGRAARAASIGHHHHVEMAKTSRTAQRDAEASGAGEEGLPGAIESGKAEDGKFAAYLAPAAAKAAALRSVLGLAAHCAADGFALGAAAGGVDPTTQALVAGAMVAHKAPMAFGLAMHLASLGLPHVAIRPYIFSFAAVAPCAALLTYLAINSFPLLDSTSVTAGMLLLSGGSFLQVATLHVLPGVIAGATMRELLFLAGGAFLPLIFTQLGGGHSHGGHHHHLE